MTDKELMQQALDALELYQSKSSVQMFDDTAKALRERLAQPDQEPVAVVKYMNTGGNAGISTRIVEIDDPMRERLRAGDKLFTAPPPRQWQGLTDEEIEHIAKPYYKLYGFDVPAFARAIETRLKEKNT